MDEKIFGILKNVGELFIGKLVKETNDSVTLKNVVFLGVKQVDNRTQIDFIPAEMLSLDPPLNIRNFLKNPTEDQPLTFYKKSVLRWDYELNDEVKTQYVNLTTVRPPSNIIVPDNKIITESKEPVKLF